MTTKNWLKDLLLFVVVLSGCLAIAGFLLSTNRVKQPAAFAASPSTNASYHRAASGLDALIEKQISSEGIEPAGRATELQIYRRLSLGLTGTLPSVEEIREVSTVSADQRVDWYLAHLLEDRRTSDYLAERFSRAFVGVETGPFLIYRRRRFATWLSEQLHRNVPYDAIVNDILTSDGLWTDSPQVNFYTYNIIPDVGDETKPDPIRLAARTSRAFLGMRIDCLQCHDDFLGTMNLGSADEPVAGTQMHFHSLASFFSQVRNSITGIGDNVEADMYQYKLLDEPEEEHIEPLVPFGEGLVDKEEESLRKRLAGWLTSDENRPFARAAVNRIWAILFGKGLIDPVDNMTLDGPFPVPLEYLSDLFIDSGYDVHGLIRTIVFSDAFQRNSIADFEITKEHQSKLAVFPNIRLRPDQVAGAIAQSTSLKTIDSTSHIVDRLMKYGQENDFVSRFGDAGEDEFTPRSETIAQRLLLMNGEMVRERLDNGLASVSRVAILSPSPEKAVETIYLATLTRMPTPEETNHFAEQLASLTGYTRRQKVIDIYWALINSTEFVWNY